MPTSLSPRYLVALTVVFIAAVFIFAGVYTATQHKPTPHGVLVGTVGGNTEALLQTALTKPPSSFNKSSFKFIVYKTPKQLEQAMKNRKIYAGLQLKKKSAELFIAPAAGKVLSDNLELIARRLLAPLNVPLTVTEVTPLGKGDTSGLSSYTFQYGLLVPSFFFGLLLFLFAHGSSLYWRLGLITGYAVGAGVVGALTVDQIIGALPGHFAALAGLAILYAALAALVTYGLCATMSWAGAALAGLGLILVGNSTGGGSINQEFLPDVFRSLGQAFPNGAFIRSVRDTVYFGGHNTGQAMLVLTLWAVGGLVLILAADPVRALVARLIQRPLKAKPAKSAA